MGEGRLPLEGIVVLELGGLAPAPFCGKILRDFGAEVVHVAKGNSDFIDVFDVLIDPYRPGVLEKLGLDPQSLLQRNPRLIVARLSGWGHSGPLASAPGHDLNYLALTGVLSTMAKSPEDTPYPPHNLLADMAGGGLMCAMGILMCIIERFRSGKGQIIDSAMVDGVIYLSAFLFHMKQLGLWSEPVGRNLLDQGAYFYNVYKCKDGKYMAVACLEPRFYNAFLEALVPHLSPAHKSAVLAANQYDSPKWPENKQLFSEIFLTKPRNLWSQIVLFPQFSATESCVSPILTPEEAIIDSHNQARSSFPPLDSHAHAQFQYVPRPAPRLSRTPGVGMKFNLVSAGEHSREVLERFQVPAELVRPYTATAPTSKL